MACSEFDYLKRFDANASTEWASIFSRTYSGSNADRSPRMTARRV
jgi:hypothetical protein